MKKVVTPRTNSTGIKDVYSIKDLIGEVVEYYHTGKREQIEDREPK